MPRIPDSELQRLKTEISLVRLIQSQGYELKKRGKDWVMRCVFHDDDTASLVITEHKNLYHCFGCNAGGSVLDWVMHTQGVSLPHAVTLLREGAALTQHKVGVERSQKRQLPSLVAGAAGIAPVADSASDNNVNHTQQTDNHLLHQVVDYYHANLKQSVEALAYLQARGLTHPELIDTFKLGYANKSLTYRIPAGHTALGKSMRAQLQGLGVYRQTGHEHLNGCLVVPVIGLPNSFNHNQRGQVIQLYGRRIMPNYKIPKDQPRHLYLPRPLVGVWNEAALMADKEIILCEALIDAMTFWCAGFRNVIAAYGVNGLSSDHMAAFKHYGTQRILIAYDRDEAGDTAAAALAKQLQTQSIEAYRVLFPKDMDANSYALKVQPASKILAVVLQEAVWLENPSISLKHNQEAQEAQIQQPLPLKEKNSITEQKNSSLAAKEPLQKPIEAQKTKLAHSSTEIAPLPAFKTIATQSAAIQEHANGDLSMACGERLWRIRGFDKNNSPEQMRINLQVRWNNTHEDEDRYHVDSLDLYAAKARSHYSKAASLELGCSEEEIKHDLGRILLQLEQRQDAKLQAALAPKEPVYLMNKDEEHAALELLQSPNLMQRIQNDLNHSGIVGENTNLLAGYLAAVSRKLAQPLAILIQSSSAAGKSSLMEAILQFMPEEERIQYSAMTGQSLYYLGEHNLKHKILAISEEEGVRQAAYALKLLQSEGSLTIASTGKDEATGNLITKQYKVQGPVMLMLTTTAIDIDEELLNRCMVLTINESQAQTQAIHAKQREAQTLAGLMARQQKTSTSTLHQNAQRLLKSLAVVNPYANSLSFNTEQTRTRRDHIKYLSLINTIALLHQYQRPKKHIEQSGQGTNQRIEYIEVQPQDIELANQIAHELFGRSLDELAPQPRRLLSVIQTWVHSQCQQKQISVSSFKFTRRQLREHSGFGDTQLKIYLAKLTELEYLSLHYNGRRQAHEYELKYDGNANTDHKHLMGLIEPQSLNSNTNLNNPNSHQNNNTNLNNTGEWSEQNSEQSGCGRVDVGMQSDDVPTTTSYDEQATQPNSPQHALKPENALIRQNKNMPALNASLPMYARRSSLKVDLAGDWHPVG